MSLCIQVLFVLHVNGIKLIVIKIKITTAPNRISFDGSFSEKLQDSELWSNAVALRNFFENSQGIKEIGISRRINTKRRQLIELYQNVRGLGTKSLGEGTLSCRTQKHDCLKEYLFQRVLMEDT